jgi:hypothetical protein
MVMSGFWKNWKNKWKLRAVRLSNEKRPAQASLFLLRMFEV